MIQDFRFAFRQLLKTPGFTIIAVLTLALAIGVNSAIFALINGVVLRPMARVRPAEVVNVFSARQNANRDFRQFSHTEYQALRASREVFADVAAVNFALAGIGRDEGMRRSFAFLTSENFFSLMGVEPALGRFYNAEECRPNANIPVVVVSHVYWKRMGGRPDFVGSTLHINGQPFTVIGISPEGFSGLSALIAPDIWLPLGIYSQLKSAFSDSTDLQDLAQPKSYALNVVGRLQSGLTIDSAKPRLPVLAQRFTELQPADAAGARELQIHKPSRFSLSTGPDDDGPVTLIGALLMGMAAAVLLIASLNLANMLLARGTARAKEIAVRLALGASRWRIIRQLLSEGLLLAVAGGLLGLFLSLWSNGLILNSLGRLFTSMSFSIILDMKPDAAVLGGHVCLLPLRHDAFQSGPGAESVEGGPGQRSETTGGGAGAHRALQPLFRPAPSSGHGADFPLARAPFQRRPLLPRRARGRRGGARIRTGRRDCHRDGFLPWENRQRPGAAADVCRHRTSPRLARRAGRGSRHDDALRQLHQQPPHYAPRIKRRRQTPIRMRPTRERAAFSPRSLPVTSMPSASAFSGVAISPWRRRKTRSPPALRSSTKRWRPNCFRKAMRSVNAFDIRNRPPMVRRPRWK